MHKRRRTVSQERKRELADCPNAKQVRYRTSIANLLIFILAATYFPRRFPPKYRRRSRLSRPCSEWERVGHRRYDHQKSCLPQHRPCAGGINLFNLCGRVCERTENGPAPCAEITRRGGSRTGTASPCQRRPCFHNGRRVCLCRVCTCSRFVVSRSRLARLSSMLSSLLLLPQQAFSLGERACPDAQKAGRKDYAETARVPPCGGSSSQDRS